MDGIIVRDLGLLQSTASTFIVDHSRTRMTTSSTSNNISTNSLGFISSKAPSSPSTCHICSRLLYSFEEVLVCRVCHGSYHWRCVKPDTISHYGENENFLCDKCNDVATVGSSHRLTNGGIKIKSPDSIETTYRDFANVPTKINSIPTVDTTVINAIRYFEEKSQVHRPSKTSDLDEYLPSSINGHEYHQRHGQHGSETRTSLRRPPPHPLKQNGTDKENDSGNSTMFQANYQYTPLKEYAAMKKDQPAGDTAINGHCQKNLVQWQKEIFTRDEKANIVLFTLLTHPSLSNTDRLTISRYGTGLRYNNHGYDAAVSRLVETPLSPTSHFTSPTIDNLSMHNREHSFVSSTNVNINERTARHHLSPQASNGEKTPLSPLVTHVSPTVRATPQPQHADRQSTVGSDSGIVMVNSNHSAACDETQFVEKKLTDLVQQLGKQLENDAQKINEKLEFKLNSLEDMIHQQTYIIRRQDEVIERLKSKIFKIETERDHFRERLTIHERREQNEKKQMTGETSRNFSHREHPAEQTHSTDEMLNPRKSSNVSPLTTDYGRPSTKKTAAPRIDHQWTAATETNHSAISELVKTNPVNQERLSSASPAHSSTIGRLASSVPLAEPPAAASRLDDIIHQSSPRDLTNGSAMNFNQTQSRQRDRAPALHPIPKEQTPTNTGVHHADAAQSTIERQRSHSSSSSTSSSSGSFTRAVPSVNVSSGNTLSSANRNSNVHRSFESLRYKPPVDQRLKPTNKTASLEFSKKPVRYDSSGSIYMTSAESKYTARQSQAAVKGWLRKQNRDSFLKRIERYYCTLATDALLMYRHDTDRTPQKEIYLKGAKVLHYEDAKHGPSLELTWSNQSHDPKHYHFYALNAQEAEQWVAGIQAVISNLDTRTKWVPDRANT